MSTKSPTSNERKIEEYKHGSGILFKLSDIDREFIGNLATTITIDKNIVCCGWMDLHIDEQFGESDECVIKVHDADEGAVFVHKVGGVFVKESLESEKVVTFNYRRYHGVVPSHIADTLCGKRSHKGCKEYDEWFKNTLPLTYHKDCVSYQEKPVLVWEWLIEE